MAIAALNTWLNDPNRSYNQGKYLYEQYGTNKTLLALLNSGSTSFHLKKLTDALILLNSNSKIEPKPLKISQPTSEPVKTSRPEISYSSAPDQIQQIIEKKRLNYARARKLFEMFRVMESPDQRCDAALEILDLMDKVNEAWGIIDEWNDTGHIREQQEKEVEASIEQMNLQQLLREKGNLAPNISKDRRRLKLAVTDKDKIKYAQRLTAREARYKLIVERISGYAI